MAIKLNKKDIIKESIKLLVQEIKTSRADIRQSAVDDSAEIDSDYPDFIAPGDQLLADMEADEENYQYWKSKFDEDEENGFDPYEYDPIRDAREEEEAYNDYMRGKEEMEDNALERMQEQIIRQIIKNTIKENYYNLMPTPNAEPVKTNGNGVEATIAMKGTPKLKANKASKEAEIEKTPLVKHVSDKFNKELEKALKDLK